MISIARILGAPESVPAGRTERERVDRAHVLAQRPRDLGDDVDDVRVRLDLHQALDVHAAVHAHAAEVVAAEVHEHHVLGALLLVGEQLGGDRGVVLAARPGAGDRARGDVAAVDRQQRLRRGADDLEVLEVEEVHVRRRVHRAQPAIDAERLDRVLRRPALGRHHLVGVAGADVLDDARDVALELLAAHVGLERRVRPRGVGLQRRQRAGEPRADLADRLDRAGVRGVDVGLLVQIGVGEDRDRVACRWSKATITSVSISAMSGSPSTSGLGSGRRSTARTQSKPKNPTAPPANGGRPATFAWRTADTASPAIVYGSAVLAQAPADDLLRTPADERPAADLLPLLGGLQQEGGPSPRSFRKAETGVSQSSMKRVRDRDQVVIALERPRLLERRRRPPGAQRRRSLSTSSASLSVEPAAVEQHGEVVEHVGGLVGHALVGLLARGAGDLLGLLLDLLADERRVGEQLVRVRALARVGLAVASASAPGRAAPRAAPRQVAGEEAGALPGVAGGAGGLDEGEHGVVVAVDAQGLDGLRVAGRRALVPELVARAAEQVQLARLAAAGAALPRSCRRGSRPRPSANPG